MAADGESTGKSKGCRIDGMRRTSTTCSSCSDHVAESLAELHYASRRFPCNAGGPLLGTAPIIDGQDRG